MDNEEINSCLGELDAWFDSMRVPGGYGGRVVHWWRDCLDYSGAGLDWRYEGIIIGYLTLWAATGNKVWLGKAKRAGNDLVKGQLPSGTYRNSCFELNPDTCGTPHEAACDLGLLRLAQILRNIGDSDWREYYDTAERNLLQFYIGQLWDGVCGTFRDDIFTPTMTPNKVCTAAEAFFAFAELTGEAQWATSYAVPALGSVLAQQVSGGALDGAIHQNNYRGRKSDRFFPFYVARCIPALLAGMTWTGDERYAEAVRRAANFVLRYRFADGSFPQVLYSHQRINRYPHWVAGVGDILRCLTLSRTVGVEFDEAPTLQWLISGRLSDGGIRAAVGFGRITPGNQPDDPRDHISVCGWSDKAFRYLASLLSQA